MIPLAFEGLAASFHAAPGRRGVVLVTSVGFEELCAHRMMVALADNLAARGMPTLRFDLHGTGDSAGTLDEPDRVQRWLHDIAAAIRWMRRDEGCTDVDLVGFRLGALLAVKACATHDMGVDRLALLAPPASGRAYLRELKLLARVIGQPAGDAQACGLELAGFQLSAETVAEIARLDWSDAGTIAARDVMVCALQAESPAAEAFRSVGGAVATLPFDGYEALMCDPTASIVPFPVVDAIGDWLASNQPTSARTTGERHDARVAAQGWREEGVSFGPEERLAGIICEPAGHALGPIALLTNPGGVRRTGWGRMWVDTARALAAEGISSLRFDFSNLDPISGEDGPAFHYGEKVWTELVAATDFAAGRGYGPVVLVGACSGAYHCLRAASVDTRVEAAILVNQLCFDWGPEYAVPLSAWMMQKAGDVERRRRAADEDLSELSRIRAKLMAAAVSVAKTGAKSALRTLKAVADLLPSGHQTNSDGPEQRFRSLAGRGCAIHLIQAEGDGSVAELERHFGPNGERALALPGVTRTVIPGCDHMITPKHARAILLDAIRMAARAAAPENAAGQRLKA